MMETLIWNANVCLYDEQEYHNENLHSLSSRKVCLVLVISLSYWFSGHFTMESQQHKAMVPSLKYVEEC